MSATYSLERAARSTATSIATDCWSVGARVVSYKRRIVEWVHQTRTTLTVEVAISRRIVPCCCAHSDREILGRCNEAGLAMCFVEEMDRRTDETGLKAVTPFLYFRQPR